VTSLANEVRPTGTPTYCSACFNQDTDTRHVDFDAACDRGYGKSEAVTVAYDDLILCEKCIERGAVLIDMEKVSVRERLVRDLTVKLDRAERERTQAQGYADRLEDAFEHRAQPIEIDHRRKPRQVKEFVDAQ
jgi:hypothetical protein